MNKKRFRFLFLVLLALAVPGGRGGASPDIWQLVTLDQVFARLENPKAIVKFLKENFEFIEDRKLFQSIDHWQSPEEFWKKRRGDCEDYALFAAEALKRAGFEAEVISFYGNEGFAHTITVYKAGGRFNVINEDRLYEFKAGSLEEALTRVHPGWSWGARAERRGPRGWPLERFQNPHSPGERAINTSA